MSSTNPRKKGRRPQMDIIDTVDDDNAAQINIDPPATQEYHWHTDYSLPTSDRHAGRGACITATHLPLGTPSDDSFLPASMSFQESLTSYTQDKLLATGMSTLSFLDPDHEAPAEFASASNDNEGTRLSRPLGDHPLLIWKSQREEFLEDILRLESPERTNHSDCDKCGLEPGEYRCLSCIDGQMLCRACIVELHRGIPFHRVEIWTGSYFKKTTLGDLGLVVQLGHKLGQTCLIPAIVHSFVVIDVDGIHTVRMGFCECTRNVESERYRQLLRSRLWPATTIYPQTAATFRVLNLFQVLSFMSKVSAYEFYHTVARLSDNTGLHQPPDRYDSFLRIMREWRHLHMLKRFGRGHEQGHIEKTQPGQLALRCPACPHPRLNLPDGWLHNLQKRWLYRLFIAVDANFRLRRLNISDEFNDPSLNQGYAYFVEEEGFKTHLEKYGDVIPEEEKSTCNNHDVVKLANSRGGKGAAVTGIGAVVCGRHDMKRPLSVGDLQKGERYINMDYFILSTLSCDTPPDLVISYNIACQWHKKFFDHMAKYPAPLRLHQAERNILYLVPKFHLPAHILKCRNKFSFNFSAKVGRTDGEAPERGWAVTNALANSTKEMGPGSRRDTLDDHFGDYNWRKIIIIASTICEKYKDAIAARAQHVAEFISYEDALRVDHLDALHQWKAMVITWESDRAKPNPFAPTLRPVTENAVRLELALEEKTESSIEIRHDMSPSEFIAQGLQLEEAQARLIDDIKELGAHSTDLQRTRIQQHANRISCKIEAWTEIQKVYMPKTSLLRARDDDRRAPGIEIHPTKIPLYLPSTALRLGAVDTGPNNTIVNDERRLWLAQAHDTLAVLRDHLLLKSYLTIWRQRFSRGQRYGTRANNLMHRVERKISADATRYRVVYAALDAISTYLGRNEWKSGLLPLRAEDIRGLDSYDGMRSEGGEEGLQEALRIEWCKSRARAQRWQEECELLTEEIHRVKVTFQFYNNVWNDRARKVDLPGAKAYALKQAALWKELEDNAGEQWNDTLASLLPVSHEMPDVTLDLDSRGRSSVLSS
ncbi:hypothetical protein ARMSODRAFT_1018078 [Armillaria solidipes]|uniref:CxC2-like cysteine cluster KDZ transposase-associated domain-containing protein n=1 Tax=Armillaria solidipes TaxID=1076256 RepID=A0A2H3C5G6_9AGAR|nr:hypothetical protein ARMSODRAFT_1018078 [Armillaria solidipes]